MSEPRYFRNYRVIRRIGGGGYSDVYEVRAGRSNKRLALKVFKNPYHLNTFNHECRTLEVLKGRIGVPEIQDAIADDECLCIITALCPGRRLDRLLANAGNFDETFVIDIINKLLKIFKEIHSTGYIHSDVKPSNILYDNGALILLDWGLANATNVGTNETILANQNYVAPEVYFGRRDVANDFYSLGCSAYQLLTGHLPYHLSKIKDQGYRSYAHCRELLNPPTNARRRVSGMITRLLAKEPEQRILSYDLEAHLGSADKIFSASPDIPVVDGGVDWLRTAAMSGIPYAQCELGRRLNREGRTDEARHWFELASAAGYLTGKLELARLLMKLQVDSEIVDALLECAASAGEPRALNLVGMRIRESDPERARTFFLQAAQGGLAGAQNNLGLLLEKSFADPSGARHWFEESARRGNSRAQNNLARLYSSGEGGVCDEEQALNWLRRSAKLGNEKAAKRYAELCRNRTDSSEL